MNDKLSKKVETELSCKATAALVKEIKKDLEAEDKSLKEILNNDEQKEEQDEEQE